MKLWTDEEVIYLKENWNKKKIIEIAEDLNRTYTQIYYKSNKLELGPNIKEYKRKWTEKDESYLEENWGSISIVTLAKNLNRPINAIQLRAARLGLGPFLAAGEYITLNVLMNEVRGAYHGKEYTIKQWEDKGLPIKKRRVKNCSFKVVYLNDWWEWAEMNSTLINFAKLKPLALGKEPKWLEEQRRADTEKAYFMKTPWTESEDNQLRRLVNAYSYSYRDISLKLRRTEGAIKRRFMALDIKGRPIKANNHNPWTEDESTKLIELYHKGHTPSTMANYIDRSAQACGGKVERLIKEGIIFPRSEFRKTC